MKELETLMGFTYLTPAVYREKATAIEEWLLTQPQAEYSTKQLFLPGVYTRELAVYKGTLLSGCVHLEECITIISKGEIWVSDHNGVKQLKAGDSFVTPAGMKRIGIAVEDTICVTVHKYDGEPLDEDSMKQVIGRDTYALYDDYLLFKKEIGLNEEEFSR